MPITINVPSTNIFWPGGLVSASTDLIGPIPITDEWWISLVDQTTEAVQLQQVFSSNGNKFVNQLFLSPGTQITATNSPTITSSSPMRLLVELRHQDNTLVESTSKAITYDAGLGLPLMVQHLGQGQGGLTEQEHTWLDTVQEAVQQAFRTVTGLALETPIGSVVAHPDVRLLNAIQPCATLTGSGQLNLTPVPGIYDTVGVQVTFQVVPPGLGLEAGVVDNYRTKIAQMGAIYKTNNADRSYILEVHDFTRNDSTWLWSTPFPDAIVYYVTPGCQIRACLLAA